MISRFLFISGVLLLLFPVFKLPGAWTDWLAFGIGIYLVVCALYEGIWKK